MWKNVFLLGVFISDPFVIFFGSEEIAVFEVDFLWHRYVLQDSRAKIAALTYIIRTKSLLNEIW